jgi:Lon protease (S16) C-terminal proteolytic domain
MRRISYFTAGLVASFFALASFALAESAYRAPDLEKVIFDTEKIKIDEIDRSGLVNALIGVGRDFDMKKDGVEYDIRAQALAIASRLDKNNAKIKDALSQLKQSGQTVSESNKKDAVMRRLAYGVKTLTSKAGNEANELCAAYICDIALRFDKTDDNAKKIEDIQKKLTDAGRKADWTGILGAAVRHSPQPGDDEEEEELVQKEVIMPGGPASSFARNQSTVNALVVRQLPGGEFAGGVSTVNVTALKEEGQKNLLFTFNQKVGPMMGGSLEEVIKFLRVRHEGKGKIPSGYKIDIGFQDKYVPKDGPSAATVFTLVLDSLITGEEIDDTFAATGDITADGKVQKIGGASGKIRGATKRGCKIVGLPEGNAKDVDDVLLMDGPEQLLDIQIFSMKDFDQAHAISRKIKSAEVQSTLDAFSEIVRVCKAKSTGTDPKTKYDLILKNPATVKRLQAIVEKMPNHYSAKLLLAYVEGKNTKSLTLAGSFHEIQTCSASIMRPISRAMMMQMTGRSMELPDTLVADAKTCVKTLNDLKKFIDPRIETFRTAMLDVVSIVADGKKDGENDKTYSERLKSAMENISTVGNKLQSDPDIMEEMN